MKRLTKNNARKVLAVALTVIVGAVTMMPDSAIRTNADEGDAAATVEATTEDVTALTEYTISEDALAAADETAGDLTEETTEETTEITPDVTEVTEESSTEVSLETDVTSEEVTTTEEVTTEGTTEEPVVEENTLVVFDHIYNEGISLSQDFSSCELLAKTSDPSVFTKNTNVVSEYEGVYLLRFNNAEETKSAYSYYYDKVNSIEVNKVCFSISTVEETPQETPQETEAPAQEETPSTEVAAPKEAVPDVADLSGLNQGNDALSEVQSLPDVSLSGAIALIDTGCSGADKCVSVLGGGAGDDNGHGTKMFNAIKEEYPSARVLSIKALDASGKAQISDIYAAIKYAIDSNVSIINLSMVALRSSETAIVEQAVNEAISNGIVVVGAAGNQGMDASSLVPSGMSGVVVAGACDDKGMRQSFSNYGSTVDYNVVADSTSEASAVLSAMIARDGASNLKVNEGKLFATDYTASETDAEETTTEATTEDATTEATTEGTIGVVPDDATVSDATKTDADKKPWNVGELIDGLFEAMEDYSNNGFNINVVTGNDSTIPAGRYSMAQINAGGVNPPYGSMTVNGKTYYWMCGNVSNTFNSPFRFLPQNIGAISWQFNVAFPALRGMYFDYYRGAAPTGAIPSRDFHDAAGTLTEQHTAVFNGKTYNYTDDSAPKTSNFYVKNIKTGRTVSEGEQLKTYVEGNTCRTDLLEFHTGTGYFGTTITIPANYVFCYTSGNRITDIPGGPSGKTITIADGIQGYFYTSFSNNSVSSVKASSAGYYIDKVYCLIPTSTCKNSSGKPLAVQRLVAPNAKTANVNFNIKASSAPFSINVVKSAANPGAVQGNAFYSLNGAQYTLYKNAGCTDVMTDINGNPAVFTISAAPGATSGFSGTLSFAPVEGTFYLKETRNADSGFTMSQRVEAVTITQGVWGTTKTVSVSEGDISPFYVHLIKRTAPANVSCVENNPNYSLNGAEYTVYMERECINVAKDKNGNPAVLRVTAAPGAITASSNTLAMNPVAGTYFIKETKAPDKGYQVDGTPQRLVITAADFGATKEVSFDESTNLDPVNIVINKVDANTGEPVADGAGDLSGAEFTMKFYAVDISRSYTAAELAALTPARSWVFKTIKDNNGDYSLEYDDIHKVSGDELYREANGDPHLPFGYITIQETKAPDGYLIEGATYGLYDEHGQKVSDDDNGVIVARADADGQVKVGNIPNATLQQLEKPIRADFNIRKVTQNGEVIAGAKFKITNTDTGESHIFFTDENGEFDSASVPKKKDTNKMDHADGYSKSGIYFGYDANGTFVAPANNDDKALNYGHYVVEEVRTRAIDGLQLAPPMEFDVTSTDHITVHELEVSSTDVPDMDECAISTVASSASTGDKVLVAKENETIKDVVSYSNLKASTDFVLHGSLMVLHSDGLYEPFTDENGTPYEVDTPFTTRDVKMSDKSVLAISGEVEATFTGINTTLLKKGDKVVVFEELRLANGSTHYDYSNHAGESYFPNIENDINNEAQTLSFITVGTNAEDVATSEKVTGAKKMVTIKDAVDMTGLIPGKEYTLRATLHKWGLSDTKTFTDNTDTGNNDSYENNIDLRTEDELKASGYEDLGVLTDEDGNEYIGELTFTAEESEEQRFVEITYDASLLEGESIVVFEDLSHNGVVVATHSDITSEPQTLHHPKMQTSLRDAKTLTREVCASGEINLIDSVACQNFIAGKTYTVYGILIDKDTKEPVLDKDGNKITGYKTIEIPEDAEGTEDEEEGTITKRCDVVVDVPFTFDGETLDGKTLVAYERAILGDKPGDFDKFCAEEADTENIIAKHEDISDVSQTVYLPKVSTTATGDIENLAYADEEVKITDVVKYENLRPDRTYEVTGTLHLRYVNEDGTFTDLGTLKDKDGKTYEKTVEIKTEEANNERGGVDGSVEVEFTVDASLLAGKTLVCFETITRDKLVVATHNDISDKGQEIDFPKVSTSLTDKQTENRITYNGGSEVTLTDTVHYDNLIPGKEYELRATLHVKNGDYVAATSTDALPDGVEVVKGGDMTDATALYIDGKPVTGTTTFTPDQSSGDADVTFTFDAAGLGGYTLVCAEKLYYKGVLIGIHADLSSKEQTSNVPRIHTLAVNNLTGTHMVKADGIADITDYVYFENFKEGETYRAYGTLMNQTTGEPVKDKDGNNVTGYTEFSVHGTDDLFKNVTVTDAGETNLGYYDQAGTDKEEIYNAENADAVVSAVADGREEVTARRVVTEDMVIAYFTDGTSTAVARHQYITISRPTVSLGVTEGKNASVKVDINTEETSTNATGGIDGIVKVQFAFDASCARGLKTVVFEEVYNVGKDGKETLVADHKNISDEDQSLIFPDIHTTFTENTTGSHDIPKGLAEVTLTDRVAYTNLQVGHIYTVTGTIHVKGDKSGKYKDGDVLKYEDGTPVTKSVTFTAQSENGSVDVAFTVPASIIPKSERIVAFEKMEEEGAEIAVHMDLEDENQSVTPPCPPSGPPKTGVIILNILIAVIVVMLGGVITFFIKKKKRK